MSEQASPPPSAYPAQPAAPRTDIIESGVALLLLIDDLSSDFRPRRLKDVIALVRERQPNASSSTVHRYLNTLKAASWAICTEDDYWSLDPKVTALAARYQGYLARRFADLSRDATRLSAELSPPSS